VFVHQEGVEVGMSALVADESASPDSMLYYAPPRHRGARGEAGIRPVLERLSRGEPSPPLLPAIAEDDFLLPSPALSILAPDPFSVVGKMATAALCVATLAAGGVFFFGAEPEPEAASRQIAAPMADRLVSSAALPMQESEPAAPPAPETDASAPPPDDVPPTKETATSSAAVDVALIAPLKMWEMFPATAALPSEIAVAEPSAQAQRQPSRHRRTRRARLASSDAMETQTASAQTGAAHATQPNPLQAAFQKIFGAKQ
jgi:hypothetical protein